jgi:iron complex outermembrane recepter protein
MEFVASTQFRSKIRRALSELCIDSGRPRYPLLVPRSMKAIVIVRVSPVPSAVGTVINALATDASAARPAAKKLCILIVVFALISPFNAVRAQHASDDPVAAADDAFGLTLGLESIGMYGPGFVRGFSPQVAGNVRIDGLYFDQQGPLSNRVVEGSTVRVGISEIGYAFPAPTGTVDYDLRHPGNASPAATIVASAGFFQAHGISIDASLPLVPGELQLPIGATYQVSTQTPYYVNPGYTSTIIGFGATPQWRPNDWLTLRGIFDWTQTTQAKTLPIIFTAGDYQPPVIERGYYGQNWAEGNSLSENYGGIAKAALSEHWSLAAGVFRSIADSPISYSDLYVNTLPTGMADHQIVGYPDQRISSTSGEVRLTDHFGEGAWRHDIVFLARGRDTLALYGGSDVVDFGPSLIYQSLQVPEPTFNYSERTHDRTELWSEGLAYRGQWQGHGEVALGLQQESYDKDVTSPGSEVRLTDKPLRAYGTAAVSLSDRATAYAGYTQGLEDSGTAPSGAQNRGAILPAARTWQVESGIRYLLTSDLKLIAGIFQIEKPYFNLDTADIDRELGVQRARGLELSLSGQLVNALHVTAGALLGEVRIIGPQLSAEGVGEFAFGQPRNTLTINADYKIPRWPAVSVDLSVFHFSSAPASVDDALQLRALTLVDIGGRYRFSILGKPATLRLQMGNATNTHYWNVGGSPGFSQNPPRCVMAYLAVDT